MQLATYISKCNGNSQNVIITPAPALEQYIFLK